MRTVSARTWAFCSEKRGVVPCCNKNVGSFMKRDPEVMML